MTTANRQSALKRALRTTLIAVPIAYVLNTILAIVEYESSGVFGDTFGAANAFFSGTALLMLVYAVILQRDELDIIKAERDDTRRILAGQERLADLQRNALNQQNFEQTFFSLVDLAQKEKADLLIRTGQERAIGSALSKAAESAKSLIKYSVERHLPEENHRILSDNLEPAYHLVSLLRSLVTLIERSKELGLDASFYREVVEGIVDDKVALCVAAYNASTQGMEPRFRMTYRELDVHHMLADEERNYMQRLFSIQQA